MAANLRITTDAGTVLLSLVGSAFRTLEYVPARPEAELTHTAATGGDGAELLAEAMPNVVEPARVAVLDDVPLARSVEGQLQDLFRRAAHRALTGEGDELFWEVELRPGDGYWRAPLIRGDVELEPGALGWQWAGRAMVLRLLIERRPYFEGARTALACSNSHGSGTGGVPVWNHDDGGNDSWVNIAGSAVTGKLPTRLEIELTATTAAVQRTYDLFVGVQHFGTPTSFPPALEAEAATALTSASTFSGGSNGQYRNFAWSGGQEQALGRFALPASLLGAARGGYYRIFARLVGAPAATLWLRARVQLFDVTNLRVLDQIQCAPIDGELQELGSVQLPPYLTGDADVAGLSILLTGQNYAGGANSLNLDYLYLMPVASFRHYRPKGYGLSQNARLVDTGTRLYTEGWAGGGKIAHYAAEGPPLMIWPGRDQRVHILQRTDSGNAPDDRTLSVRLFYRPRRVHL